MRLKNLIISFCFFIFAFLILNAEPDNSDKNIPSKFRLYIDRFTVGASDAKEISAATDFLIGDFIFSKFEPLLSADIEAGELAEIKEAYFANIFEMPPQSQMSVNLYANKAGKPYALAQIDLDLEKNDYESGFALENYIGYLPFNKTLALARIDHIVKSSDQEVGLNGEFFKITTYIAATLVPLNGAQKRPKQNDADFIKLSLGLDFDKKAKTAPQGYYEAALAAAPNNKYYVKDRAFLNLDFANCAYVSVDKNNNGVERYIVNIVLNNEGSKILKDITQGIIDESAKKAKHPIIAICVDGKLEYASHVASVISKGFAIIAKDRAQAFELAKRINEYCRAP